MRITYSFLMATSLLHMEVIAPPFQTSYLATWVLELTEIGRVEMEINDAGDSDDLTLFTPTQTQNAEVTIANGSLVEENLTVEAYSSDGIVRGELRTSSGSVLSPEAILTLGPDQSETLTFIPLARSNLSNDIFIRLFRGAEKIAEDRMTNVEVQLPAQIRSANTPSDMAADRIPPRVPHTVEVMVTPTLFGNQAITLAISPDAPLQAGQVLINGLDSYEIRQTETITLESPTGNTQTQPDFAGQLRLEARLYDDSPVLMTPGFSVAAIPQNYSATYSEVIGDDIFDRLYSRGVVVTNHWESDSGVLEDLDMVETV